MAIARGAGTEIIRSISCVEVDSTTQVLIFGVAHHIYTVLSVIAHASSVQADGNWIRMVMLAYDAGQAGATGGEIHIFQEDMSALQTYVWNDKFSFNGNEPTDFSGAMSTIVEQDAIADQAQATAQKLVIYSENAADNFDVHCTYLDQNNA